MSIIGVIGKSSSGGRMDRRRAMSAEQKAETGDGRRETGKDTNALKISQIACKLILE